MNISPYDYANVILSLIFVSISVFIGIKVVLKYRKYREKTLIYVGIAWIVMVESWMPAVINFIVILITGNSLPIEIMLIIGNIFLPVGILLWMIAFTELVYKKKQKLISGIFIIWGVVFEILFFYFLITNPSILCDLNSPPLDIDYYPFMEIYQILLLVIFISTGIIFALKSFKTEDQEIRLKGKFLILAFLSFLIGALLDITSQTILQLIIARMILMTSSIEFYCGFILPEWIKKICLKKENI